jgi:hypothetical protein
MISLCTVVLSGMEKVYTVLIDSILKKTKLVTEVILVNVGGVDGTDVTDEEKTWQERNVTFKKINYLPIGGFKHGHASGLHRGIALAQNEYVMLCDPDIFFYTNIDEFYLDVMNKHKLNVIGVSHHAAINQSYFYFPCVMNMLIKKKDLPDENFLKGEIKLRPTVLREPEDVNLLEDLEGKYLMIGPIPKHIDEFPNKDIHCNFDVGCNLYLWSKQQNWKWLSFQTLDCHTYTTKYYRSNIKIPRLENIKLLYHMTTSAMAETKGKDYSEKFQNEYKEMGGI